MFQHFTHEEAERLKLLRPSPETVLLQMLELKGLAKQAERAKTAEELAAAREALLLFREGLGPDDDTYDVVIDPDVDQHGINLLCYCNLRINGQEDHAQRFFPSFDEA